jgi:homoserine dehydrogenase
MAGRVVIGMLGLGVVGSGVAARLTGDEGRVLSGRLGRDITLKRILVRDLTKKRTVSVPPGVLTDNPQDVIGDSEIDIVIELTRGEDPAREYISSSLMNGKHVVTANKEVVAKHGPELLNLARDSSVEFLFEASVGGGIPVVRLLREDLVANRISSLSGIMNGTTNYILTRMADFGTEFSRALEQAQALGYAEPDPTEDIEGVDATYKLTVLAMLAFGVSPRPEEIYREGISTLSPVDFDYARELGYAIKLLGIGKREGNQLQLGVHPTLVPRAHLLAHVDDVFNAIAFEASLTGTVMMYGRGAGSSPTSSSIISDVANIMRRLDGRRAVSPGFSPDLSISIAPAEQMTSRYYLRVPASDPASARSEVEKVLWDCGIKVTATVPGAKDAIVLTEPTKEADMRAGLDALVQTPGLKQPISLIRVLTR